MSTPRPFKINDLLLTLSPAAACGDGATGSKPCPHTSEPPGCPDSIETPPPPAPCPPEPGAPPPPPPPCPHTSENPAALEEAADEQLARLKQQLVFALARVAEVEVARSSAASRKP